MRVAAYLVVVCCFHACSEREQPSKDAAGWSTLPNEYAEHFKIQARGAARRVIVLGPGGDQDTLGKYVLGSDPDLRWQPVKAPLQRVAVVSTTHLPFFSALGISGTVVGAAHTEQIRDTVMRRLVAQGKVIEVGRADGLDRETLIGLAPEAIFDPPFGTVPKASAAFGNVIAVTEYLEQHPLGRAEWIRFFGLLLGRTEQADSIFNAIKHRYATVRSMNIAVPDPPTVFFGSSWNQTWYAPPANSYMERLITDAGGRYWAIDSVAKENVPVALEQLLLIAAECDHFGLMLSKEGKVDASFLVGGDPRLAKMDAVQKGGFYGNSARSDLFGQALLEPETILRDLRCIFRPNSCRQYTPTYFFPVDQ